MIRALICDIYGTLLEVSPPQAPISWEALWKTAGCGPPTMSEDEFSSRTEAIIAQEHRVRRLKGLDFPEVDWLDVLQRVIGASSSDFVRDFAGHLARRQRCCTAMPGAARVLQEATRRNIPIGLCSNCQDYTLTELAAAFPDQIFDSDISFLSFCHGFSKPSPRVFAHLTNRLAARGISPQEILMIGDRLDNDIIPARSSGWHAWHLIRSVSPNPESGTWVQLMDTVLGS